MVAAKRVAYVMRDLGEEHKDGVQMERVVVAGLMKGGMGITGWGCGSGSTSSV